MGVRSLGDENNAITPGVSIGRTGNARTAHAGGQQALLLSGGKISRVRAGGDERRPYSRLLALNRIFSSSRSIYGTPFSIHSGAGVPLR